MCSIRNVALKLNSYIPPQFSTCVCDRSRCVIGDVQYCCCFFFAHTIHITSMIDFQYVFHRNLCEATPVDDKLWPGHLGWSRISVSYFLGNHTLHQGTYHVQKPLKHSNNSTMNEPCNGRNMNKALQASFTTAECKFVFSPFGVKLLSSQTTLKPSYGPKATLFIAWKTMVMLFCDEYNGTLGARLLLRFSPQYLPRRGALVESPLYTST